jgi:hypothetical protein
MAAINILLYTDSFGIASDDDKEGYGTSRLKRLLETKTLAFAEFEVTVINRNAPLNGSPPPQRLTKDLLLPFDELWLFGFYQIRVEQDFDKKFGGRDNELDQTEIDALEEWMNSGGILISGDHSEPPPNRPATDPIETFLCLGRALGHKVKRAGELRQWKGPFTNVSSSSFNTLVRTAKDPETEDELQADSIPQSIILLPFEADGSPHTIFRGTKETTIRILPDHKHEGQLILPDLRNWPPVSTPIPHKPKPRFVAMGCDKRSCESHPVLTVYNGDEAGVGRIIADSSWHHYLNKNLEGLEGTSAFDLLKQLFHNMAFYLAPLSKRQEMAREMFEFLVGDLTVQEERGNSSYEVGKVALQILSPNSTGCEIDELLRVALPTDAEVSNRKFASPERVRSFPPTQDLVLGAIINRFFQTASERLAAAEARSVAPHLTDEDIVAAGLEDALMVHIESLKGTLSNSPRLFARLVKELQQDH